MVTEHHDAGDAALGESVVFDNVTKSYGGREVLHSFSLSVLPGEMVSLLGPSGCGKSTALRCLAGFEQISGGRVSVGGREVSRTPPRSRGIGMVFQQYSLFPNMTVADNVAFGLRVKRVGRQERRAKAADMLSLVGLGEFADRYPSQLSGGQQQRVAVARALILNPGVLLLDEPLSALDAKIRVQLRDEIRSLQLKLGITTIFVTHDQEEALAVSDRIAVMHDGNIEQIGTPKELYLTPKTPFVSDFVGQSNKVDTTVGRDGAVTVCECPLPLSSKEAPNSLVTVFIRPENVVLSPDDAGDAVVVRTSFLGSIQRTTVHVDAMELVAQHDIDDRFDIGQHVDVAIKPYPVMSRRIELRWAEDARKDGDADAE